MRSAGQCFRCRYVPAVPDVEPPLLNIVGQRYAADLLVELAHRPGTAEQLRSRVIASRRGITDALRGLAALGAVRRCGHDGTWDVAAPDTIRYELTPQGVEWAAQLDRYDVWVAICDRYLRDGDSPENQ